VKLRLIRHRRFKMDALQIFARIGENNFDAATRFLAALDDDLHKLADMPGMGALRNFRRLKLKGIRSWPVTGFGNYLIFYRIKGPELQALRVIHGARNLERALLE
jgi:toxin ParE1/3/4